jgi:hypothetical protein
MDLQHLLPGYTMLVRPCPFIVCLYLCFFCICLFVSVFVCMCLSISVLVRLCLSISVRFSVYACIMYMYLCVSVYVCLCLYSICLSISVRVRLCLSLSVYVCICLIVSVWVCICLFVSLSWTSEGYLDHPHAPSTCDFMYNGQRPPLYCGGQKQKYYLTLSTAALPSQEGNADNQLKWDPVCT